MKRNLFIFASLALVSLTTSCANYNGLIKNENNQSTQVVLSQNNFTVVESITGEATATYVFGIGGLSKNALIQEARTQMVQKAKLNGTSKAIINEKVEIKTSLLPIVNKVRVNVSAEVIEFTR